MLQLPERTWAEIDLDAVRYNYDLLRRGIAPDCRILAVIKANGYGHGIEGVARVLSDAGAGWFAVSNLDEAEQLRRLSLTQRILILSHTPPTAAARLAALAVTPSVVDIAHARALSEEAVRCGVVLTAHIKVETGMGRVGCSDAREVRAVAGLPGLRCEGIFTHFAAADDPDEGYTRKQFIRFTDMLTQLEAVGVTFAIRHCCNSAAAMRFPDMHLDMVRPGIILYGIAPGAPLAERWPLRHAMALRTSVAQVKELAAGATVGYGRTFAAPGPMRAATVLVGYADGYPRSASNKAAMLVNGRFAPVIGRVCMDQTMLDVTDAGTVSPGDVVTVFGEGLPVERLAAWDDTIPYEIVCQIGKRVPRVFFRNGEPADVANGLINDG